MRLAIQIVNRKLRLRLSIERMLKTLSSKYRGGYWSMLIDTNRIMLKILYQKIIEILGNISELSSTSLNLLLLQLE